MKYKNEIAVNNLKRLRLGRGLRQQDVAMLIGIAYPDRISHWEKGTAVPSIINLFRLAKIYETLPHKLYLTLSRKLSNEMKEIKSKLVSKVI